MGRPAKSKIFQTVYIRDVRISAWQAFRAEALRRGLTQAEALETMISEWVKEKT